MVFALVQPNLDMIFFLNVLHYNKPLFLYVCRGQMCSAEMVSDTKTAFMCFNLFPDFCMVLGFFVFFMGFFSDANSSNIVIWIITASLHCNDCYNA